MKQTITIALFFICVQNSLGQNIIQFKVSKLYCMFNFLETASKSRQNNSSITLEHYIAERTQNDKAFLKICDDFKNIRINYDYQRDEFPETRRQHRSTYDLIIIALVNSRTLEEFKIKTIGILPNSEQQKLLAVLKKAEAYYEKIIWKDSQEKIEHQLKALEEYATKSSQYFNTINHFYNSSWTTDIPFVVSLYPIPGSRGNTTATPHANSLCVGVLVDEKDHINRMGVVLHEMCHVLYDEQDVALQHQLEKYFASNSSPYRAFAHNFFDEALATALGNGWAYKNLNGSLDTNEWYNNEYINGFGKVLYPLVDEYISKNQQLDSLFIDRAINLFANKFPKSLTDYGILLNNVTIYNDAETATDRRDLMNTISKYFQVTNSRFSSPIAHPISIKSLKENDNTQFIIINKNHIENQKALKKIFPQLTKTGFQNNSIYSFYDHKKRAIIILNAMDNTNIDGLLKEMKTKKYFDRISPLQK